MRRHKAGFTLTELIIVVGLITLIASLFVPAFSIGQVRTVEIKARPAG